MKNEIAMSEDWGKKLNEKSRAKPMAFTPVGRSVVAKKLLVGVYLNHVTTLFLVGRSCNIAECRAGELRN
jgi:hypothetical protein